MAENTYITELYLCNVPWSSDYKNLLAFHSGSEQQATIKSLALFSYTNVSFVPVNGKIRIKGGWGKYWNVNYVMFKNNSQLNKWFYAFVDNVDYVANNTAEISITLDVWQTYMGNIEYLDCMIERAHVSKSDDVTGKWLAPEPFSMAPEYERQIGTLLDPADWEPQWVLHCASYYNKSNSEYEYSGTETDNTYGEYGKYINSMDDMKEMLENYGKKSLDEVGEDVGVIPEDNKYGGVIGAFLSGSLSESVIESIDKLGTVFSAWLSSGLQDHRDELIGVYAIPQWGKGDHPWATNERIDKTVTISLTSDLACGYTPRNKKMLTSMCKAYALYNRNGFRLPMQPELFSANPTFTLSCVPMGVSSYYVYVDNYRKVSAQCQQLPYSCERRVGYDANTGLNKALNVLSNGISLIGSGALVAGGIASGGFGVAAAASAAGTMLSSGMNMVDALGQQGATFGSNGDLLSVSAGHATLRFMDVSPTYAECEYIDDYLDMFGYSIQETGNIRSFMNTRSNWNYIKTNGCAVSVSAPNDVKMKIQSIFDAGTTIWHNISTFGDYSKSNS